MHDVHSSGYLCSDLARQWRFRFVTHLLSSEVLSLLLRIAISRSTAFKPLGDMFAGEGRGDVGWRVEVG